MSAHQCPKGTKRSQKWIQADCETSRWHLLQRRMRGGWRDPIVGDIIIGSTEPCGCDWNWNLAGREDLFGEFDATATTLIFVQRTWKY